MWYGHDFPHLMLFQSLVDQHQIVNFFNRFWSSDFDWASIIFGDHKVLQQTIFLLSKFILHWYLLNSSVIWQMFFSEKKKCLMCTRIKIVSIFTKNWHGCLQSMPVKQKLNDAACLILTVEMLRGGKFMNPRTYWPTLVLLPMLTLYCKLKPPRSWEISTQGV